MNAAMVSQGKLESCFFIAQSIKVIKVVPFHTIMLFKPHLTFFHSTIIDFDIRFMICHMLRYPLILLEIWV